MTIPPVEPKKEWWTRPATILPLIFSITLIIALLTPEAAQGRFGDSRLTSHVSGSLAARVLADVARSLGWRVIRRDSEPMPLASGGKTIHALLSPVVRVSREEAHAYLDAVRNGDALLLSLDDRNPLSDSLGVAHYVRGSFLDAAPDSVLSSCRSKLDFTPPMWPDGRVHLWGVRWLREEPAGQVRFAKLTADGPILPAPGYAAIGFPYGKGRIVVVSDGDMLRNDVIRHCQWGVDVIDVAILEWLRAGGEDSRATLAFDEYHQGYGSHAGMMSATSQFLVDHPFGRMLFQLGVAFLILLLAVAPRALPPQHIDRVERRDPLEQVDALAHAYQQVNATRTIVARLVRGLRWRVDRGAAARAGPDDQFLGRLESATPALKADLAIVRRGLNEIIPEADLPEIGNAIRRIEFTLTSRSS